MALSTDRATPERDGHEYSFGVAASTKIYAGALVALDSSGNATKGATATGLRGIGRAEEQVDNSGGSAGDKTIRVRSGTFRFANSSAGDALARGDIGATCYIVDDQTVAKTNGTNTRSAAGKVVGVESDGVWVE